MVLDNEGTPVWYRKPALPQALNVTALSDDTIAWSALGAPFERFNLSTQATEWIVAPLGATDFHELQQLANGDLMMLSNPLKANVDLTALQLPSSAPILDCVLQEVDPSGRLVWQWRASDHLIYAESTHPLAVNVGRQLTYDPFHCNSIDVDSLTGDLLLSARHTDAVYRISKSSGAVMWKMAGNPVRSGTTEWLNVVGDPEGSFHAQHDARFQPGNQISLYDDQSWDSRLAARGVVYHADLARATATLVWSYASPDGNNSAATGSFRRLDDGDDNVIGWGVKRNTLFSEVNARGQLLLNVTFPNGEFAYRVVKLPVEALDHNLLRLSAGLPPFVLSVRPAMSYIAPGGGPATGGGGLTIMGSGFTGASAVTFGSQPAEAMTILSDNRIMATAPAGTGSVALAVSGPGGTSTSPMNQLAASTSDSTFEDGVGSWIENVNAVLNLSSQQALSPPYSLRVAPISPGFMSAFSGRYAVIAGAQVTGGVKVLTPAGRDPIRAFITFYDASGNLLAIDQGAFMSSSPDSWTDLAVSGVSPSGAAFVAVGVDDGEATGALYLDDASLVGSSVYTYQ